MKKEKKLLGVMETIVCFFKGLALISAILASIEIITDYLLRGIK